MDFLLEIGNKENKQQFRDERRDDKFGNIDLVTMTEN